MYCDCTDCCISGHCSNCVFCSSHHLQSSVKYKFRIYYSFTLLTWLPPLVRVLTPSASPHSDYPHSQHESPVSSVVVKYVPLSAGTVHLHQSDLSWTTWPWGVCGCDRNTSVWCVGCGVWGGVDTGVCKMWQWCIIIYYVCVCGEA